LRSTARDPRHTTAALKRAQIQTMVPLGTFPYWRQIAMKINDKATWLKFESEQWKGAVRNRGLQLNSLDRDERILVFDAIVSDLDWRKKQVPDAA
jgi:hypothetical protein